MNFVFLVHTLTDFSYEIKNKIATGKVTLIEPSIFFNLAVDNQPSQSFYVDRDSLRSLYTGKFEAWLICLL